MRKVLIVIYSLFSIIAFLALCGVTGYLFYTHYTANIKEFEKHFNYIKKDIRTWYKELNGVQSMLFRTRMKNILKTEDRLFLISIYSPGKGLLYAIEQRKRDSVTHIKNNLLDNIDNKDPDWEGRPEYRNLPFLRYSLTKKLLDEPMLYIEVMYYPLLKDEIARIIKWGFLSLILWLTVTIIIRLFAATKPPTTLENMKKYAKKTGTGETYTPSYETYPEEKKERPHLKNVKGDSLQHSLRYDNKKQGKSQHSLSSDKTDEVGGPESFHSADRKGTLQLFSPQTGLGWKEHLAQRLGFEINRTASFNQDMVLAFINIDNFNDLSSAQEIYQSIARIILNTFPFQDLAFEYGKGCFSVILPDSDLYEGIKNLEIFQKKITGKVIKNQAVTVSIGLSSRNGRLLSPETLIRETRKALDKAITGGRSRIIAFKADPEKYRKNLSKK